MLTESQIEKLIEMCKSSNNNDFMLAMSIVAQYYPDFEGWDSKLVDKLGVGFRCCFWGDILGKSYGVDGMEYIILYMREYNFWLEQEKLKL